MVIDTDTAPWSAPLRVADLPENRPWVIELVPDAATRTAIAAHLGILSLPKLRLVGTLRAGGRKSWVLEGELGASVVQACVVTLDPVNTRIDEPVLRRYVPQMQQFEPGSETEMPEDDSEELLGAFIDPAAVMVEALALALPPFPRRSDVGPGDLGVTEDGGPAMTDEEARPFSVLSALRDRLAGEDAGQDAGASDSGPGDPPDARRDGRDAD